MGYLVLQGDARRIPLAGGSVHCVVTSSPYYNLRDYETGTWVGGDPACRHTVGTQVAQSKYPGSDGAVVGGVRPGVDASECRKCGAARVDRQIGLEKTPDDFCAEMVKVGRELWRVLRDDGVLFWNIGESFYPHGGSRGNIGQANQTKNREADAPATRMSACGLKGKDIMGIPYRLAMALQADGWYWRDTIIWAKAEVDDDCELDGSGMPGSQQDRCTFAYEVVLQLAKSPSYYFDIHGERATSGATLRNVWRINTEPNRLGHFALMPRKLAERCIRLGTSERGCCPACLAPWRRLVERQRVATRTGVDSKVYVDPEGSPYQQHNGAVIGNRDPKRHTTVFRTVGWEPTCRCGIDRTAPCRVFDPFGGLSTTAVAADALGRIGITTDLSHKYCVTAHQRLSRPHAPIVRPSVSAAPMPLFAGVEID